MPHRLPLTRLRRTFNAGDCGSAGYLRTRGQIKIVAGPPQAQGKAESPFRSRSSKLNCKGVIRELSNYIDGDLDPVVKQELERHLEHCEDCTMIVDQTKKTIQVLCDSQSSCNLRNAPDAAQVP